MNLPRLVVPIVLAAAAAIAQIATPQLNQQLTNAAQQLTAMQFEPGSLITVRGVVTTLVWPEHGNGMLLVEADRGREKYAFSTAKVGEMAKQGFSRFTVHPGTEVIVTGALATGARKIGPGFAAARADIITKGDGSRVFDRSRVDAGGAK